MITVHVPLTGRPATLVLRWQEWGAGERSLIARRLGGLVNVSPHMANQDGGIVILRK